MLKVFMSVMALALMLFFAGGAVAAEDTLKIVYDSDTMEVYYSSEQYYTGTDLLGVSVADETGLDTTDDTDPTHGRLYTDGHWNTGPRAGNDPVELPRSTDDFPVYWGIDFGQEYELTDLWVWNCNMYNTHSLRGLKYVYIDYGVDDGEGGIDWTALGGGDGEYLFAQATESDSYTHNTTIDFGNVDARYVMISVRPYDHATKPGTYGESIYGLSELRFHTVPEPGTMVLAGFGVLLLLVTRRKR